MLVATDLRKDVRKTACWVPESHTHVDLQSSASSEPVALAGLMLGLFAVLVTPLHGQIFADALLFHGLLIAGVRRGLAAGGPRRRHSAGRIGCGEIKSIPPRRDGSRRNRRMAARMLARPANRLDQSNRRDRQEPLTDVGSDARRIGVLAALT